MAQKQVDAPVIAISTKEAARSCGLSEKALRESGAPRVRLGGRNGKLLWLPSQLNAWFEKQSTSR